MTPRQMSELLDRYRVTETVQTAIDAELERMRDETQRLLLSISAAPHAAFCHQNYGEHECDCWKAKALVHYQWRCSHCGARVGECTPACKAGCV